MAGTARTMYLLLLAAFASADYLVTQGFSSETCQGEPVATQYGILPDACSLTRLKAVCINSSAATQIQYADSSCTAESGRQVITAPYPVCTPSSMFAGKAVITACVSGSFTRPTTGLVKSQLYDSTSCLQNPPEVMQSAAGVCIPTGLGGSITTCGKDAIFVQQYSGASCTGSVIDSQTLKYGCDLGNRSINDCYGTTTSAPASLSRAAVVGGAVGGTLAVLALGGAAVFYFRRQRSASGKEATPLL